MKAIALMALERKTGARGLRAIMVNISPVLVVCSNVSSICFSLTEKILINSHEIVTIALFQKQTENSTEHFLFNRTTTVKIIIKF